jgi:hypothetical protein
VPLLVIVLVLVLVTDFSADEMRQGSDKNPNNSENPVARFEKIANLCGPTQ